jgi:hypothetical protein
MRHAIVVSTGAIVVDAPVVLAKFTRTTAHFAAGFIPEGAQEAFE